MILAILFAVTLIFQSLIPEGFRDAQILTRDGYTHIADITRGTILSSMDLDGNIVEKKVTNVSSRKTKYFYEMDLEVNGDVDPIVTKWGQLFIRNGEPKWTNVCDIKEGDMLRAWPGEARVKRIARVKQKPQRYYQLSVKDSHIYFVSKHNVLAHNIAAGMSHSLLAASGGTGLAGILATLASPPVGITVAAVGVAAYFLLPMILNSDKSHPTPSHRGGGGRISEFVPAVDTPQQFFVVANDVQGQKGDEDSSVIGEEKTEKEKESAAKGEAEKEGDKKEGEKGTTIDEEQVQQADDAQRKHFERQSTKELQKSQASHEALIEEHKKKLENYKKDPESQDNKDRLKNANSFDQQQRITNGRINNLNNQIRAQTNRLDIIKDILSKRM